MTKIETDLALVKDLTIVKGARHCKIVDVDDNIVFRTTNLRDAEGYLALVEENRRLQRLLDARGIAPHRLYTLEGSDLQDEVVIVGKSDGEAVIVRHLSDGREEVCDLDDVVPIADVSYFMGTADVPVESVSVSVRVDRDADAALIRVHRSGESARQTEGKWRRASYEREKEDEVGPSWSDKDSLIFTDEVVIDD